MEQEAMAKAEEMVMRRLQQKEFDLEAFIKHVKGTGKVQKFGDSHKRVTVEECREITNYGISLLKESWTSSWVSFHQSRPNQLTYLVIITANFGAKALDHNAAFAIYSQAIKTQSQFATLDYSADAV